ncbi:unnamed protein product [marine sediment metagenome]|uniref:Uncharacterized protein n=1 Tax=marine sediment metagenome TaxID=412755 RepID=X0SVB1_9ZZZZ
MTDSKTTLRWMKWLGPSVMLLQIGPCTVEAFRQSLENEVVLSASSAVFTVVETVFMNLFGV